MEIAPGIKMGSATRSYTVGAACLSRRWDDASGGARSPANRPAWHSLGAVVMNRSPDISIPASRQSESGLDTAGQAERRRDCRRCEGREAQAATRVRDADDVRLCAAGSRELA